MPKIPSLEFSHTLTEPAQKRVDNFLNLPPKTLKYHFDLTDSEYQATKRYFKKIQQNGHTVMDKYTIKDCFRMYGSKTTLQSVKKYIRNILIKDDCYDIDMKNCCYSIVKYIIKNYFNDSSNKFDLLLDYADNREKYYTQKFDKQAWISVLFSKNPSSWCNGELYAPSTNKLINQIHAFQKMTISKKDIFNITDEFKINPVNQDGSDMSKIFNFFENKIIQQVIAKYKDNIVAPIFDGVLIKKECDLDVILNGCNKIGEPYGVEFLNKEFETSTLYNTIEKVLDADIAPAYEDTKYEDMKTEFELNHFMVKKPLCYVEHDDTGNYTKYNKGDFKDLTAPFFYWSDGGNKINFFGEWIQDDTRRVYDTINWIPSLDERHNIDNNYNSFQGFKSDIVETPKTLEEQMNIINDDYDGNSVKLFTNHLHHIAGNDLNGFKYLLGYLAHMFQKPEELPLIALIFKSKEGSGKDLMTDILGEILGNSLIYKDSKMENIVGGTFNASLKQKLLVQINEVCGKDGHFNKELLKDLITVKTLKIREMRTDIQEMLNYLRLFLCTNNMNAINLSKDDRRYVMFKCGDPKSKSYYDKLVTILGNKKALDSIYSFFMNYDISNFDIKKRYISPEYKTLQQHNSNPFYEYLYEFTEDQSCIRTKGDKSYVTVKELDFGYKNWLEANNMNHIIVNSKTNKLAFLDCYSVKDKKFYVDKKQVRGYEYTLNSLRDYLLKHHVTIDEEVVEFDC